MAILIHGCQALLDYLRATEEVCGRLFYLAAGLLVSRLRVDRERGILPSPNIQV